MKPIILIHGGAGSGHNPTQRKKIIEASLQNILDIVFPVLKKGQSATEAVVRAVELLENDPLYNAGFGSKLQSDGVIRMSASLMDGKGLNFSGCVNVQNIKNPIRLAEKLQFGEAKVLSEKGAEKFAKQSKIKFASPYSPERMREYERAQKGKYGTVGAIALDRKGNLAAATSTGGRGMEYPHRVSDTPTVAGNYANTRCAVSATGFGEHIVNHSAAATLAAWVEAGMSLRKASQKMLSAARKHSSLFGYIALDAEGNFLAATSTKYINWAVAR